MGHIIDVLVWIPMFYDVIDYVTQTKRNMLTVNEFSNLVQ